MSSRRDILRKITATGFSALAGTGLASSALAGIRGPGTHTGATFQDFRNSLIGLEPHVEKAPPTINLLHAWEVVAPKKFHEYVFVTWCGTRFQSTIELSEEFARRRQGASSLLPDHPVFDVCQQMYGNWRLPVYREHRWMVIGDLTGCRSRKQKELDMMFLRREIDLEKFRGMLRDNRLLPESVQDADIPMLWEGLRMTTGCALPLGYCAMLTGKVLERI